ncbi:MAG: toprim domain-containing protein [Candidatus Paceibacterota bacterium]|jgi:recombination protein RecR
MDSLHRLEEIFAHFPGIGPRQAKRFVYYLLNKSSASIKEFTQLVEDVRKLTFECEKCHRFFINSSNFKSPIQQTIQQDHATTLNHSKTTGNLCSICSDISRDQSILMVVARDSDFESIEKSGTYRGLYFVLGGTVPILDKEPEKRIRLEKLLQYINASKEPKSKNLKEIILSLNTTPDGEHTTNIVKEAIWKIIENKKSDSSTEGKLTENLKVQSIKISTLGRGLSTGAELEYADSETIKNALENRR